jgi:hypothetical protein
VAALVVELGRLAALVEAAGLDAGHLRRAARAARRGDTRRAARAAKGARRQLASLGLVAL